ncbi:ZIP family metal transporter [Lachnospiraceae bacterium ZAX-1]
MSNAAWWAFLGTGFTFIMTMAGSSVVFLFRGKLNENIQRAFLGFASGVMIAASVWSLLLPAIAAAEEKGISPSWLIPAGGFILGGIFLYFIDRHIPFRGIYEETAGNFVKFQSTMLHRNKLLVLAVTTHNIPEGMAVGLSFALAAQHPLEPEFYVAAFGLALGIGIQNFPEGAAISLPLKQEGYSNKKAFLIGTITGIVEPICGVFTTLLAVLIGPLMPLLLAFAAGTMIYVVADELIPQAQPDEQSNAGTIGVMLGFLLMMILDVALG